MISTSPDTTSPPKCPNQQFTLQRTNSQTLPQTRRISAIQQQRHLSMSEGIKKPQIRDPWPSDHEFLVMLKRHNPKESSCALELPVVQAVENRGYRLKTAKFQKTIIKLQKMLELTNRACSFNSEGNNSSQEAINVQNAFGKIVDDIHELFRHVPEMIPPHPVHLVDTSPFCSNCADSPSGGARKQVEKIKAKSQHKLHREPSPCAYKVLRGICWLIKILDGVYNFSKHCQTPHILIPGQSPDQKGISVELLQTILQSKDEWPKELLPDDNDTDEILATKLEMNIMYVFFSGSLIRLLVLTSDYIEIWLSQLHTLAARQLVEQWYSEHIAINGVKREHTPKPKKPVFKITNEERVKEEEKEEVKQLDAVKEEQKLEESPIQEITPKKRKKGKREKKEKKENQSQEKAKKQSEVKSTYPVVRPIPQRLSLQQVRNSLSFVRGQQDPPTFRMSYSSSRNSLANLDSLVGDQFEIQEYVHSIPPRNSSFLSNQSAFRRYDNSEDFKQ